MADSREDGVGGIPLAALKIAAAEMSAAIVTDHRPRWLSWRLIIPAPYASGRR